MDVLLLAISFQVAAGIGALLASKWPRAATALGAGGAVLGCLVALVPVLRILFGGQAESWTLTWDASHGIFQVEMDALSAFFLLPVLVLAALAAVYGGNYLLAYRERKSLGPPWFFFNLFVAGMALVVVARTALLFLVAWEVMSISAWCLVTFEHESAANRRAGWVYLIATHLGVAFLYLAFLLLGKNAGTLDFAAFRAMPGLSPAMSGLIFVLVLVGFGAKAGFVPFHVWLPEAHPAAPSHVSALMSGVMIKMGLYGILRFLTFLGPPGLWWGPLLAAVGLLTGLLGITLALHQRDVKRVLAYSSIENIGLIAVALGVGLWGLASDRPVIAELGIAAGMLHVWNHALMKGLMFLCAGSVLHGTGTRDMEKLGGLMKRMPWTAGAMMAGAVAIAGLPPLNGFVSKWLIYLGLLRDGLVTTGGRGLLALFAAGLLTLIGGLAAINFVRLTGIVLLGSPRSEASAHAHESSPWLLGPIALLVVLCLIAAVLPTKLTGWLSMPLAQILSRPAGETMIELASAAPLELIGRVNAAILFAAATAMLGLLLLVRVRGRTEGPTWGCGYVRPTVRMQYTGASFTEMIADNVLPPVLRSHLMQKKPEGLFPSRSDFVSECPDPVSEKVYEPFFRRWADRFTRLRILQQGKVTVYLLYIALMVVLTLAWVSLRTWWSTS